MNFTDHGTTQGGGMEYNWVWKNSLNLRRKVLRTAHDGIVMMVDDEKTENAFHSFNCRGP